MTEFTLTNGLLVPSRRKFMHVLSGAIVAPMIVPAANLMDIDTLQNRLVVGYMGVDPIIAALSKYPGYGLSLLNSANFLNKEIYDAWKARCPYNNYSLVRRAEIGHDIYKGYPAEKKRRDLQRFLDEGIIVTRNA
jgi:hypothetical protein